MDAHPVPQNVTNFEFHLVGDMTLKQFGYLAAGLGFAYLIFFIFASQLPFIAWPIIIVSALTGISFAFLPIKERPLDHWMGAFFTAIFKPTRFEYKSSVVLKEDPFFKKRLNFFLSQLTNNPVIGLAWGESPTVPYSPEPPVIIEKPEPKEVKEEPVPESKLPTPETLKETVELAEEAQTVRKKIIETEKQLSDVKSQAATPGANKEDFIKDFQEILNNLQKLNNEAGKISKKLALLSKTNPEPVPTTAAPAKSIPTISLSSVPNILNGIVTDLTGNYIENAILVAHDKQKLPVRAFKTNKLGQFIAATPLPNGTYTVTCEKDNLVFDVIKIDLTGQVMQPVIISAKKGAV